MTILFKSGYHWPTITGLITGLFVSFTGRKILLEFSDASKYELPDNYAGWNKITGRRTLNKRNGRYLVWRYIAETDTFEVSDDYYRRENVIVFPLPDQIKKIKGSGSIVWDLPKWGYKFPILPYFGGVFPAPKDVKIEVKCK
jgi:hypothetical protein